MSKRMITFYFGIAALVGVGLAYLGSTYVSAAKVETARATPVTDVETPAPIATEASLMSEAPVSTPEAPVKKQPELVQLAKLTPAEALALSEHEVDIKKTTNAIERKRQAFSQKFDKFVEKETNALKGLGKDRHTLISGVADTRKLNVDCFALSLTEETRDSCGKDVWAISEKGEVFKLK